MCLARIVMLWMSYRGQILSGIRMQMAGINRRRLIMLARIVRVLLMKVLKRICWLKAYGLHKHRKIIIRINAAVTIFPAYTVRGSPGKVWCKNLWMPRLTRIY